MPLDLSIQLVEEEYLFGSRLFELLVLCKTACVLETILVLPGTNAGIYVGFCPEFTHNSCSLLSIFDLNGFRVWKDGIRDSGFVQEVLYYY